MLDFQTTQPKDKTMSHKIPRRLWKSVGADLCIVDYHRKLPVIKQVEGLSVNSPINTCKIIFSEYGLPSEIVSQAGTNFILEKSANFYKTLYTSFSIITI